MEKTIKINLGGSLFQIDEEAYKILRQYLQDIDSRLGKTKGGAETLEDIELRIAELFLSMGGQAGVISKENVEAVISTIGSPETFENAEGEQERETRSYIHQPKKKMYRNPDDTIISGVCGGIGAYLDVESVWIRILFILFTCFFGIGFFVYVALWIALPVAKNKSRVREMHGENYQNDDHPNNLETNSFSSADTSSIHRNTSSSNVGNAFNEMFKALGRVWFILVRIFLIIVGTTFVLSGFIMLVTVIMILFFRYPDYFSTHSFGVNLFYLPDFLNYVVNPHVVPWIIALSFIVVALPLLALIYWGLKMTFWFKARDGVLSLTGLVIWVSAVAALSMILFNEGISYSEIAKTVSTDVISKAPDNLYIVSGHSVSQLNYDKEISLPDEDYTIYFTNDNKGLFISTSLIINNSNDNSVRINIRKRSAGRSKTDATKKADALLYNYKYSGDTLYLDEYFRIPDGTKWSLDNVGVNLYIPAGTVVHFDKTAANMFRQHYYNDDFKMPGSGDYSWVMTENGLRKKPELTEKIK